jgi:hypothetical protein
MCVLAGGARRGSITLMVGAATKVKGWPLALSPLFTATPPPARLGHGVDGVLLDASADGPPVDATRDDLR